MAPALITLDPRYANVLPKDFLRGYASAAYQIEGGASQGGRGPCTWDEMLKDYPEDGEQACNSYNMWKDDVQLLKEFGSNSYRFSISWSRVKPLGGKNDPVNEEGVSYYNNLIDALLDAGVEPTITLLHYDVPLELQKRYRGFQAEDATQLIEDFVSYAELCFERFGDRVKRWLTINEPWIFVIQCSGGLIKDWEQKDFLRTGHNCLLTHGQIVTKYRESFQQTQKGQIGIALNYEWVEPLNDSKAAVEAAALSRARCLGWFADPIFLGTETKGWDEYGDEFPRLTSLELNGLKGSADFFSINHYGTMYATGERMTPENDLGWQTAEGVAKTWERDGNLIGKRGENGHPHIVGWGLRNLLVHCWHEYARQYDMPVLVYENGFPVEHESSMTLEQIIDDKDRQEFYNDYIQGICDAVLDHGVRMAGYHCWSLLDNLEWTMGYGPRFGVTYVDKENGFKRVPKDSAKTIRAVWDHVIEGRSSNDGMNSKAKI